MKSLVKFITENGGHEYNIVYPLRLLGSGFSGSNTSCAWYNGSLMVNSRIIDYTKVFQSPDIKILESVKLSQTYIFIKNGFTSRNLISKFSDSKINNTIETKYINNDYNDFYKGFEDCRLVVWNGKLYSYGTRWDKVEQRCGCICIYELDDNMQPQNEIIVLPQNNNNCEKNWAAIEDRPFTFVYSHNPLNVIKVDGEGKCTLIKSNVKDENIDTIIKGSTQVVRYDSDTYISLVHTNRYYDIDGIGYSDYLTAFVFYDNNLNIIKMSDWFVFKSPMCEFTCGLAIHNDDVYITYSQLDCTSHLLKTTKETIEKFINSKDDNSKIYSFLDFYNLANYYDTKRLYTTSSPLYSYAATKCCNEHVDTELKLECLIKTYCNIVKSANKFGVTELSFEIINTIKKFLDDFPNNCEFYYLLAYLYKLNGDFDEYRRYKQLGDERKVNIHNYFFKYFNPNYL